MVSGTLLGYARTGSVLSHDKDMDVGLFGWEEQFEIVQRILDSGGVFVHRPDTGDATVEPGMVGKDIEATFGAIG